MKLELEISNPQKLALLIELLRSLDFVEKIQVSQEKTEETEGEPVDVFSQFYGAINTGLTKEEIDNRLHEIRQEWNRNI